MNRSSALLVVALTLSPTGPAVLADITPVNYPFPLATTGPVSGDVVNMDPVNRTIFVKEASGIVRAIHVDDHVQIQRRGESVGLGSLSLGDFVTVAPK